MQERRGPLETRAAVALSGHLLGAKTGSVTRAAFDYQNPGATRVGAGLHLRRVDDNGHVARPSARDDDDGRISLGWPAHGLTIE